MNLTDLFLLQAGVLFLIGMFGILTRKNIFKILMSINILQTGVNLLIIGLGYLPNGKAPIVTEGSHNLALFVDPLPQALILTSIVIGFGTTALGLVVALRYHKKHKTIDFVNLDNEKESEVCE